MTANRSGEIFKTTGRYILFVQKIVSDSLLLILHSEQRPVTISGKAINWNSINYWDEVFQPLSKFRVKFPQRASKYHL